MAVCWYSVDSRHKGSQEVDLPVTPRPVLRYAALYGFCNIQTLVCPVIVPARMLLFADPF
jgi:hypothetical protein